MRDPASPPGSGLAALRSLAPHPAAEPPEPNTRNSHFVLKDLKGEVSVYEIRKSKVCKQIEVLYRVPHERLDILVLLGSMPYGTST